MILAPLIAIPRQGDTHGLERPAEQTSGSAPDEALRVDTLNGAYNSCEEAIKGSIPPCKLADFVVLADDLYTVDQKKIKDAPIVRTVVGGSTGYQA